MQVEFNKAIEDLKEDLRELSVEQKMLKDTCKDLDERVGDLEARDKLHMAQINKQERYTRRDNVRIVGVKAVDHEDCLAVARQIFAEVGSSRL